MSPAFCFGGQERFRQSHPQQAERLLMGEQCKAPSPHIGGLAYLSGRVTGFLF